MRLLEKICKELGVEIGETWESNDGYEYKINEYGEIWEWDKLHDEWIQSTFTLRDVVIGELRPVWKPKKGEEYYIPDIRAIKNLRFYNYTWFDDEGDEFFFSKNLVFKTKEEAIECTNKILEATKEW